MSISITKLNDGERNKIYHVFLDGDGNDFSDQVLIPAGDLLTCEGLTWCFDGFSGVLKFPYLVDGTLMWVLSSDDCPTVDFRDFGGIKDRSNPLDATGGVLLDTTGIGSKKGSLILKMRK